MIELSSNQITQVNDIIEMRNKLYRLGLDLDFQTKLVTQMVVLVSEILRKVLLEENVVQVKLRFTKREAHYYLHVVLECTQRVYYQFNHANVFEGIVFERHEDDEQTLLEIRLKINDSTFIPNDEFIQKEQERLIQQSSGEMLQEIRNKNKALMKAIQDLKTSSGMIQTEKMRALGSMTAGVAHELNNPMMGVLNYVQYAIKHTDEDDRKYRPLMDAEKEIKRCQDIVTNLLTFSRMDAEGEEKLAKIKLSILFERILKLQAYKMRSVNVNVIKHYPSKADEPYVELKINKMQQVFLNLMTNAVHAMQTCDKRDLTLTIDIGESKVICSVADTGEGMDEETLDKIFEPFFTTKAAGQGTGLGLAVSKSIIEAHAGKLLCDSTVGKGTCFTVILPRGNQEIDQ
ncbi:MAG: GHKL domain-containing protein [Gammaproteobacteria bacterium]|nr:GHKL domain-containing protein [Gammaproteobacteria bacterium]